MAALERLGFPLSEEQLQIAELAEEFGRENLAPGAHERDQSGAFPTDQLKALSELGLLGMKVPEEYGGSGLDNVTYMLAMHGIGKACAATAVIVASSNLAVSILADHGTEAQKQQYLTAYAAGDNGASAAFALSEPHCGSDASALRCAAKRDGDHYVIDGAKMWITSGTHAGIILLFARTDPHPSKGVTCFVVERDTPGLSIGREEDKMGQRASGTTALFFEGARIPVSARIGEEGQGYRIALSTLAAGRVGVAGLCLGLGEAGFDEGVRYANERKAFGKRILDFQNTQFKLADARTKLDAAWMLCLRAAWLLDQGDRASAESSMAKLYASETASQVIDDCLQMHGGYGYSKEYTIERLHRDVRVTRIYEGASEIQRLVIARDILSTMA